MPVRNDWRKSNWEKLFERTNYAIRLTPAGELLRERAEDILAMSEKTVLDFKVLKEDEITGDIAIACAESRNISFLAKCILKLRKQHPKIRYHLLYPEVGIKRIIPKKKLMLQIEKIIEHYYEELLKDKSN